MIGELDYSSWTVLESFLHYSRTDFLRPENPSQKVLVPVAYSLPGHRKQNPVADNPVVEGIVADTLPITSPVADTLSATKFFWSLLFFFLTSWKGICDKKTVANSQTQSQMLLSTFFCIFCYLHFSMTFQHTTLHKKNINKTTNNILIPH